MNNSFDTAAFGGEGWSPRTRSHAMEIGDIWTGCGLDSEWKPLKTVLVHRPGPELSVSRDQVNAFQLAGALDVKKAREEHDHMVTIFRENQVTVEALTPGMPVRPNQLYCADLVAMTPQGAILARPASTIRAGEERWVAQTLGMLGIPVLRTLTGTATFEGADLMWLDSETAVIGRGLRTNQAAIDQISSLFSEMGITTLAFDLPFGTMHFMGMLRIVDKDLAFVWPRRTPYALVTALKDRGFQIKPLPSEAEALSGMAFNFVVLGPKKIMLPAGNPETVAGYEESGIHCIPVPVDELQKANGAVGCMTGILYRDM
ncbi:MAG: arginine deiminase-related protein [Desulfotignum sp.]